MAAAGDLPPEAVEQAGRECGAELGRGAGARLARWESLEIVAGERRQWVCCEERGLRERGSSRQGASLPQVKAK